MHVKNLLSNSILFSVLLFGAPLLAQESAALGYHLQPGTSYAVKTVSEDTHIHTIDQKHYQEKGVTTNELIFDILNVDADGNTAAKITFVDFIIQRESAQPETQDSMQIEQKLREAIKGQHIEIVFTRTGKILRVKGLQTMQERLCQQIPDGPAKEMFSVLVNTLFNEDVLKASYGDRLEIYPNKTVLPGKPWAITTDLGFLPSLKHAKTFTLTDSNTQQYVLNFTTKTSTSNQDATMNLGIMQMKMAMNGTGKGRIIVDRESGWIYSSTCVEEISGTATILPNTYFPDEISMPYLQKSVITVESHKL
jgi:primosomal replication protein N